jgi:indole-3-glycerol phosphate synthase
MLAEGARWHTRAGMAMSDVLAEIIGTKREEVEALARREADIAAELADAPPARDFVGALRRGSTLSVIAEIKRRSPSKGDLAPDLDPAATARAYESGGAACLSVLTDGPYFGGSPADLAAAREASAVPVLRKDFTVDPLQIDEARVMGADAVLLIVTALDDAQLRDLHDHAAGHGLTVLVEVHDDEELDRALAISPHLVGVNARDLSSFAEDLSTGERLIDRIPSDVVAVAESAIRAPADAERMAAAGFDAVLVGEALVRAGDPAALVHAFTSVARSSRGNRR